MNGMPDVAVIGGGVIRCAVAGEILSALALSEPSPRRHLHLPPERAGTRSAKHCGG